MPAAAVVIVTGDGTGNTTAPQFDPGWGNVARHGDGTAVYLGNRWAITADHVVGKNTVFPSGSFEMVEDSKIQLENPAGIGLTQYTDLAMYRLKDDPGLPGLSLSVVPPAVGTPVTMIGAGRSRWAESPYNSVVPFDISFSEDEWVWTEATWPGDVRGYYLDETSVMRWGNNYIADDGEPDADHLVVLDGEHGDVMSLVTQFDEQSNIPHEAQAVAGDSGGGVFTRVGEDWQLAGIVHAHFPYPDQPDYTVMFGNTTYLADVSKYRTQIESIMSAPDPPDHPWQNGENPLDVNVDSHVSPIDALQIINDLNALGARELAAPGSPPPYLDVNGDDHVSPVDALIIINSLNAASGSGQPVPEGATFLPAAVGLAALLGWRRRRK